MASSLTTTASASASALSNSVSSSLPRHSAKRSSSKVSFRLSPKPRLRFLAKPSWNHSTVVRAQVNEVRFFQWFSLENLVSNLNSFSDMFFGSSVASKVAVDGSSNSATTSTKSEVPQLEAKDVEPSEALPTEDSISEFIAQVASLVKLVDSRDIVELQLKQQGCEVLIRKKEALPQPPAPAPHPAPFVMHHSPSPSAAAPPAPAAAPPPPSPAPAPASRPPPASKSSHPPLLCPMPGTFYRSPSPGAPPFVKVGDKVQKGQVICIIEAMKLMNEIEADKTGTIAEILLEDGKPVSIGTPLFVIEP
uniref:Biotin carboxyl carrier protein of acetyl-CoA carboxylase n=1 Tax=Monsonia emarginata TaxID=28966 RepID=A0A286SC24_9ROSI|nr:biotin carboxyl carrier protein subunit [Monsonia emarginata]